jgi:ABC-type lipoprotein release transport system permease subunit
VTLAMSVALILGVATLAVFGPSWRASHIDPQQALRTE